MISPVGVSARGRFFAPFCSLYSVFKVRFSKPSIFRWGLSFAADPLVSCRGQAAGFGYLPAKRSPLTNTDENGKICSKSVEFAQSFIKSLRVWEIVGEKQLICAVNPSGSQRSPLLAAARSRRGSDMPPAYHSLPRRHFVTLCTREPNLGRDERVRELVFPRNIYFMM